jgi:hypothetical protein
MSYIYDNFLWEHCEDDGYSFPTPPVRKNASDAGSLHYLTTTEP